MVKDREKKWKRIDLTEKKSWYLRFSVFFLPYIIEKE